MVFPCDKPGFMGRVHVVTQAYGLEEVRTQALYLAWSALAWRGDAPLDVHVYTDAPEAFGALADWIDVRRLSAPEIRAWRGPLDFVHRLKAEMVRDVVRRYPEDKLLYLDADVFFTAPAAAIFERIGPGRSVLHERELSVPASNAAQIRKFRRHLAPLRFRGAPIDLTRDMWNAGAVGLDPSVFPVVDEWIEFIDTVYPHYKRGLVEQYGICHLLQREGSVSPCTSEVFHYWFQKDEYVGAIRAALSQLGALPLDDALATVRAHPISLPPPMERKHRTTLWDRVRAVITGQH